MLFLVKEASAENIHVKHMQITDVHFIVVLGVWGLMNYKAWVQLQSTWNDIYPFYCVNTDVL